MISGISGGDFRMMVVGRFRMIVVDLQGAV